MKIIEGPYQLDLEKVTCKCAHFKFRLSRYPKESLERLCKHLILHKNNLIYIKDKKVLPDDGRKTAKIKFPRNKANIVVNKIGDIMLRHNIIKFEFCGSYRREKPDIGDLDILIEYPSVYRKDLMKWIIDNSSVEQIIKSLSHEAERTIVTGTKVSRFVFDNIQVDVKFVESDSWPTAILHYTGSVEENVRLRKTAKKIGLKLNEYGLFHAKTKETFRCYSEKDIYEILQLSYKHPKER